MAHPAGSGDFHFDPAHAADYGTTPQEYKLWVDYVFDYFGAGLMQPYRRYAVSVCFATLVWLSGFLAALAMGIQQLYVESVGTYLFWIGICWCFNALRWLSQTYHERTNPLRACFTLGDRDYKALVSPFAHNATRNREIFLRSFLVLLPVYLYTAIIFFGPPAIQSGLVFVFPRAFPSEWHTGSELLGKMCILDLFWTVTMVHVYTGARLTLATTPLYSTLASKLQVIPLPQLVADRCQGVLQLYRTGSLMWSFGVVLAVLLYGATLDVYSVTFIFAVLAFGLLALRRPRRAINVLWQRAKEGALDSMLAVYYDDWPTVKPFEQTIQYNRYADAILAGDPTRIDSSQVINFVVNFLLPVAALLLSNTGLLRYL